MCATCAHVTLGPRVGKRRNSSLVVGVLLAASLVSGVAPGWASSDRRLEVSVGPSKRSPSGVLPWLSVERGAIVDDDRRRVLLRGFNTTTLLEWPRQPIAPLDESDMLLMRRSGFNVVRLPIAWSRLEPRRGQIDAAYLDRVADLVAQLNRHRLYVVLDVHVTLAWGPAFGGAGAPEWASIPLVPHVLHGEAGDWVESASPAVLAANAYFWLRLDWQTDFLLVWRAVAERFRDSPGVVGYDLFNEPSAAPFPPRVFEERFMWPLYARLIDDIDQLDPNHLFFVEAPLVYDLPPRVLPMRVPNLVYSPHIYTGSLWPPPFQSDPDRLVSRIHEQVAEAGELPAVPWWGELGVDNGKAYAGVWADTALDIFDDLDVGWAWWQWRQDWGWGVRNDTGDFFNADYFRHIARPFLAAAPTGVSAARGDGQRGELRLRIAADHAPIPAVVSWPGPTLSVPRVEGTCLESWTWDPALGQIGLMFTPGGGCSIDLTAA
jgi:endoglycosylceramidase